MTHVEFAADMLNGAAVCKVSGVKLKYQTRRSYLNSELQKSKRHNKGRETS